MKFFPSRNAAMNCEEFEYRPITRVLRRIPSRAAVAIFELQGYHGVDIFEEIGKKGWAAGNAWNGSYHDCHYDPYVIVWMKGPHRLHRLRRYIPEALKVFESKCKPNNKDLVIARFEARRQVRPGD
jgi:hypothetical protein